MKTIIKFRDLKGIKTSAYEMVTFTVESEREKQKQSFQLPGWIDLYTFFRGAYALDKKTHSFTTQANEKVVVVRSGTQRYILRYD
jgi:hypothetical protein